MAFRICIRNAKSLIGILGHWVPEGADEIGEVDFQPLAVEILPAIDVYVTIAFAPTRRDDAVG